MGVLAMQHTCSGTVRREAVANSFYVVPLAPSCLPAKQGAETRMRELAHCQSGYFQLPPPEFSAP